MRSDPHAQRYDREQWSRRANEIRSRLRVSEVVGRVVTLKKAGKDFFGLCPFHNEATPSFTVNDRKAFYHCFGCGVHGDAIAFVMLRQGLGFPQAVELLEAENGLRHLQAARPAPPRPKVEQVEDKRKADAVQRIWQQTAALEVNGVVDRYLRGRCLLPPWTYGIEGAGNAGWPVDLRYHGALWHADLKREVPAMVAAMRKADGRLSAVHRTYLKVTGVDVTKAGTERDKMMLGDVAGTFIRLSDFADRMLGGEGIETTLAAMQLFGRAGLAFGSRANMAAVEPPFECSDFIYAADKNKAHQDPTRSRVGERAAIAGAKAFGIGRKVAIKVPALPNGATGDFNDVLQLKAKGEWPPVLPSFVPRPGVPTVRVDDRRPRLAPLVGKTVDECQREERAAFLAYSTAEEAVRVVDRKDAVACHRVNAALLVVKDYWAKACARTEAALLEAQKQSEVA